MVHVGSAVTANNKNKNGNKNENLKANANAKYGCCSKAKFFDKNSSKFSNCHGGNNDNGASGKANQKNSKTYFGARNKQNSKGIVNQVLITISNNY